MNDPQYLDKAFEQECKRLLEIFLRKHKDYGKENILEIGEQGIVFRLTEKISRLKNLLAKGSEPANESLDDTWEDIGVYAVIAMLFRKKQFQNLEVNPELT